MRRLLRYAVWVCSCCFSAAAYAGGHAALIEIDGPIGPATSGYFQKAQAQAAESGASVIVLRLDTPGGLDTAMRDIVKAILASPVPVACWVGPGGARAASAGTYILYACQIAAMAPATNLGAATPVPLEGSWPMSKIRKPQEGEEHSPGKDKAGPADEPATEPEDAMGRKVLNDAVAYIRALAQQRDRNADWAEKAVREGASLPAEKALQLHVVDLIADDVPALLKAIDGRSVTLAAGAVKLHTVGLPVEKIEPGWRMRLLSVITHPTVAYVLMLIGIYGLLLEGYHPGAVLPGVAGTICLLLALYAFQVLPVNFVGLGLILLGVALMIAEALAPTFGVLGFGGITSFVLGSVLLMDMDVPGYGMNIGLIAGIAVSAAALIGLTLYLLWCARRAPVVTGCDALAGE
ncbi:MAG: NfeD family protein, partial [Stenotrophobium sp.]